METRHRRECHILGHARGCFAPNGGRPARSFGRSSESGRTPLAFARGMPACSCRCRGHPDDSASGEAARLHAENFGRSRRWPKPLDSPLALTRDTASAAVLDLIPGRVRRCSCHLLGQAAAVEGYRLLIQGRPRGRPCARGPEGKARRGDGAVTPTTTLFVFSTTSWLFVDAFRTSPAGALNL